METVILVIVIAIIVGSIGHQAYSANKSMKKIREGEICGCCDTDCEVKTDVDNS